MTTPARVIVLPKEPGPLEIIDVELPDPGPFQVVVKQFASGICHSQLHQMSSPRDQPVLLGHESTGEVIQCGQEVSHVAVGDTVIITWVPRDIQGTERVPESATLLLPDGSTASCQSVFTWADFTIADEQYVVKVDDDIEKEVTSIIGCAVMTGAGAVGNTAGVKKGSSVAIFGAGGVGLSAVVAAKDIGADPIIVVDLDEEKLKFAKLFGASHTINASENDPVQAIKDLTRIDSKRNISQAPVEGADYVFDCIGIKTTMEQIVPATRSGHFGAEAGGTAVLVGVPTTSVELNAIDLLVNEKKFIGSIGGSCHPDQDFPKFLDWHKTGKLDLEALVTKRYTIEQINEATTALKSGEITGRSIIVF